MRVRKSLSKKLDKYINGEGRHVTGVSRIKKELLYLKSIDEAPIAADDLIRKCNNYLKHMRDEKKDTKGDK